VSAHPLPQGKPVFSFYGDDFTGSTDALEALSLSGTPTVLFLRPPTSEDLCRFSGCRGIGIAGESRSRAPEWMRESLPLVFERLREIGAPIVQYKVCSTFDSSPEIGSIGCALEIGAEVFGNRPVAVVPAAPLLERYVAFGNLFAAGPGGVYRIDRHPAMCAHPVTPMDEASLLTHLARQTAWRIAGVNWLELRSDSFAWPAEAEIVLFDGLEEEDLAIAARRIWEHRAAGRQEQTFVVGSSGFTYGMGAYWRARGWLDDASAAAAPPLRNQGRLLVLAGSCSPATEAQIRAALRQGFHGIQLNPADFDPHAAEAGATAQLAAGRSVILYSALGEDSRVEIEDRPAFAAAMGGLLRRVVAASGVSRVVVAGGDTASYATRELGVTALTFTVSLARGAPLCRAHGCRSELELVLKGGQIGPPSFFEEALEWR
jgi:uncharacterized protein YgbK (DUF1537 family)